MASELVKAACKCQEDQYNQFCPQHGLNGYYARKDGTARAEPSRGAPEAALKDCLRGIARFIESFDIVPDEPKILNDYGKTHNNALAIVIGEVLDPQDNVPLVQTLDAYAKSGHVVLLEALREIVKWCNGENQVEDGEDAEDGLVYIEKLAEAAIKQAERP